MFPTTASDSITREAPTLKLMGELLEALEGRGLLDPDASFEEFEALMDRLEQSPPSEGPRSSRLAQAGQDEQAEHVGQDTHEALEL